MKASLLMLLATLDPGAPPEDVDRLAPIERVVVYDDRAEVTRRAGHGCEEGHARLHLAPLPASLDVERLRVTLPRGRLLSAKVSPHRRPPAADRAALEARSRALDAERRAVVERGKVLAKRRALTGSYAGLADREAQVRLRSPRPTIEPMVRAFEEIHRRLDRDLVEQAQLELRIETIDRERRELRAALGEAQSSSDRRALELRFACRGPGQAQIVYELPFAAWRPEYAIRFTPRSRSGVGPGAVGLDVSAVVRQQTGEDWEGVRLALSTARPRLAADAPVPAPFRLRGRPKRDEKVLVQARERRGRLERGGAPSGAGPRDVELKDRGQVVLLEVPHPVTVRSDGRDCFVPVDTLQATGRAKLVAVPSRSRAVHRELELVSPAPYPLLPGRARVHARGAVIGETALGLAPAGARLRVPLGVDARFEVDREDLRDLTELRGLLAKSRVLERALRTRIASEARRRLRVELRQQIPVSRSQEITVEIDREASTAGFSVDATRGHVLWAVEVEPGATAEVDLAYRVQLPEDWVVR